MCSGTCICRTCSRKCPRRRKNPCEQLGFEALLRLLALSRFLLSRPLTPYDSDPSQMTPESHPLGTTLPAHEHGLTGSSLP